MEFDVKERLVLMGLLPKESNFVTLKLTKNLMEELSFSEEEHRTLKFNQEGTQLKWDTTAKVVKDVHIGDMMMEIIVKELKEMDKSNKLTPDHFSLFEKLIEN